MGNTGARSGVQETYGSSKKKYLQDRYREEKGQYDDEPLPYGEIHEEPKGEDEVEVPYIGWTGTFSDHQNQVALGLAEKGMGGRFLKHHVPISARGQYKLDRFPGELGEREGPAGWAMCTAWTQTHNSRGEQIREDSNPCRAKAVNRSGFCSRHGGALHPLDRQRIDWDAAPRHIRFKYGKLGVEDLDDEELARGQIRKDDGTFTANRFVSSEIHDAMVKKLFERSDEKMRQSLLTAVDTFSEIAAGTAYEPADRLRASEFIFKWLRGSTPVKVEIGVDKPFEKVLDAIFSGGSREESRKRRGLEGDDILDVEVVDHEELGLPDVPELGDVEPEQAQSSEDVYDYRDERDHSLGHQFEPEPVIHYGPAGKATTHIPPNLAMADTDHKHYVRVDEHREAAEKKKEQFFKKKKLPEDIAAERKAHKEEMRKGLAKRKYFQGQGQDKLPEALDGTVEDHEDGTIQVKFNKPKDTE